MQCRVKVIIRVFLQFDIITGKILYTILSHYRQMSSCRRLVATPWSITSIATDFWLQSLIFYCSRGLFLSLIEL